MTEVPDEVVIDFGDLNSNQQIEMEEILNADFDRLMANRKENMPTEDEAGNIIKPAGSKPMFDDDGKRIRSGHINRAMIYVALKPDYPDLTLEEAGEIPLASMGQKDGDDNEGETTETT